MRQSASQLRSLPLNTSLHTPTLQRDLFLLQTIELPYFPADLNLIAEIATKETDSFARFMHFLATRIAAIGTTPSIEDLTQIVAEIEDEVAALRTEAKKLSGMRVLRGIEIALFALSIVALVLPPTREINASAATCAPTCSPRCSTQSSRTRLPDEFRVGVRTCTWARVSGR